MEFHEHSQRAERLDFMQLLGPYDTGHAGCQDFLVCGIEDAVAQSTVEDMDQRPYAGLRAVPAAQPGGQAVRVEDRGALVGDKPSGQW